MSYVVEAAEEAERIARGEIPAARLYHQGHFYVPEAKVTSLKSEIETLTALVKLLKLLLAEYEREAKQPTICEGATE